MFQFVQDNILCLILGCGNACLHLFRTNWQIFKFVQKQILWQIFGFVWENLVEVCWKSPTPPLPGMLHRTDNLSYAWALFAWTLVFAMPTSYAGIRVSCSPVPFCQHLSGLPEKDINSCKIKSLRLCWPTWCSILSHFQINHKIKLFPSKNFEIHSWLSCLS